MTTIKLPFLLLPLITLTLGGSSPIASAQDDAIPTRWFRGNTHTHSLWSDGNDFPEMITSWYKDQGYDFMSLSDHNVLAAGERWVPLATVAKKQRVPGTGAMEKYRKRYGDDWVETRDGKTGPEVKLKTLAEYRGALEKDGKFLIIQAEEISNMAGGKPVHINAINVTEVIPAIKSDDPAAVPEVIRKTAAAIAAHEKSSGRPILAHLNHPNFRWAITAEELAHVAEMAAFEVYNGHPIINHLGDATRPGDEAVWDIANTIRLAELDKPPLLGVATDDSHTYHGGEVSPGRGWVMVRAAKLEANTLVRAMKEGHFYASSGVAFDDVTWDAKTRTLLLKIHPEQGATHTTAFIGTRKGYDPTKPAAENGIGEVFGKREGDEVSFVIPKDALYLRATVTSSADHHNPSFEGQKKQAWTQPVGWRK